MDAQASYLDDFEDEFLGQMMEDGMKTKTLSKTEKEAFLISLSQ